MVIFHKIQFYKWQAILGTRWLKWYTIRMYIITRKMKNSWIAITPCVYVGVLFLPCCCIYAFHIEYIQNMYIKGKYSKYTYLFYDHLEVFFIVIYLCFRPVTKTSKTQILSENVNAKTSFQVILCPLYNPLEILLKDILCSGLLAHSVIKSQQMATGIAGSVVLQQTFEKCLLIQPLNVKLMVFSNCGTRKPLITPLFLALWL